MVASIKLDKMDENGPWQPSKAARESTSVQQEASFSENELIICGAIETAREGRLSSQTTARSAATHTEGRLPMMNGRMSRHSADSAQESTM